MTSVALKGLWGRKTRSILIGLAIPLGVAMISGTYVLTDTVQKAFNTAFGSAFRNSSAIITANQTINGSTTNPSVPASILIRVRAAGCVCGRGRLPVRHGAARPARWKGDLERGRAELRLRGGPEGDAL